MKLDYDFDKNYSKNIPKSFLMRFNKISTFYFKKMISLFKKYLKNAKISISRTNLYLSCVNSEPNLK